MKKFHKQMVHWGYRIFQYYSTTPEEYKVVYHDGTLNYITAVGLAGWEGWGGGQIDFQKNLLSKKPDLLGLSYVIRCLLNSVSTLHLLLKYLCYICLSW